VGVQPFDCTKGVDEWKGFFQRGGIEAHDASAPLKLVSREARKGFSRTPCGKFVTGPGKEISSRNR
jgi:hypothetical protein